MLMNYLSPSPRRVTRLEVVAVCSNLANVLMTRLLTADDFPRTWLLPESSLHPDLLDLRLGLWYGCGGTFEGKNARICFPL
jgi:hypothetical protein